MADCGGQGVVRVTVRREPLALLVGFLTTAVLMSLVPASTAAAASPAYRTKPLSSWSLNGVGYATLVVGNVVYVGGSFSTASSPDRSQSAARANLAAFSLTTGALITSFRADTNGRVNALATDGTRLFVGGSFTQVGGTSRARLAAVSLASGAVQSWTANSSSNVYALGVGGGVLYVGGSFSSLGGSSRSRIAAVRISDASVTSFAPGANATVNALVVSSDGSSIYAGGNFTTINGSSRPYLAAFANSGALRNISWVHASAPVTALGLAADNSRLAVGYAGYDNQTSYYSTSSGARLWANYCDGDAQAVAVIGDRVISGYHDGCRGVSSTKLVMASTSNGSTDASFVPTFNRYWGVRGIAASSAALVVAGDFTSVSGVAVEGFAIFPSTSAPPPSPLLAPAGLTVTGATTSSISLAWQATTGGTGSISYQVYRDGAAVSALQAGLTYTDTGLAEQTQATYVVRALDSAGETSPPSTSVIGRVTTPQSPPPTGHASSKQAMSIKLRVKLAGLGQQQKASFRGKIKPLIASSIGIRMKLLFKAHATGHFTRLRTTAVAPDQSFKFKKVRLGPSGKYRIIFAGSETLMRTKTALKYRKKDRTFSRPG